jgi:hypothetical protein
MTDTTTPCPATQVPRWRRRLLATALIVGAGTAVGAGETGLTSDGGRRGVPPANVVNGQPNCEPVDTATTTTSTTTSTGDAKDHPNYGPVDTGITTTPTTTWTGDAKDHPDYGPATPSKHSTTTPAPSGLPQHGPPR